MKYNYSLGRAFSLFLLTSILTSGIPLNTFSWNKGQAVARSYYSKKPRIGKNPTSAEVTRMFNYCYNSYWVKRNRKTIFNKTQLETRVTHWMRFVALTTHHTCFGKKKGIPVGNQLSGLLVKKFDKDIHPFLMEEMKRSNFPIFARKKLLAILREATELHAFTRSVVSRGNGWHQKLLPRAVKIEKAGLDLSAVFYRQELKMYEKKGNHNGLNLVYYALESLRRDFKNKGKFSILPVENIGGAGALQLPTTKALVPIYSFPRNYRRQIDKQVKDYRYKVIIPSLINSAFKTILAMEARGLDRMKSFNYLMAEIGLDLLLDLPDFGAPSIKRGLSSIPDNTLRRAAKKTFNPAKAQSIIDDLDNGRYADNARARRNRNRSRSRRNIPCTTTGFVGKPTIVGVNQKNEVLIATSSVPSLSVTSDGNYTYFIAKRDCFVIDGKRATATEKAKKLEEGGTFIVKDLDNGKVLKIRKDFSFNSSTQALRKVEELVGVKLDNLRWNAEIGSWQLIDEIEFKRIEERGGSPYNHYTFDIYIEGEKVGDMSHHPRGHKNFDNDFNARQPHYNVNFDSVNGIEVKSHITY